MSDALPWGLQKHINSQRREAIVTGNLTFPLGSSVSLVSMSSSLVTLKIIYIYIKSVNLFMTSVKNIFIYVA